jgi:O-methyltransferase
MYESTIQALDALYHKVSFGGAVIIDDFALAGCQRAVADFRQKHGIESLVLPVDGTAAWWRVDHMPIKKTK